MAEIPQAGGTAYPPPRIVRVLTWMAGTLLPIVAALWLTPSMAQAGTITIVDGPDTPPADGVYTDGYIQAQLAAGDLIIDTSAGSGPDEIRVLESAVITWTSDNQLTLDAGSSLVISGTIQHDGPANGAGGVRLLANGIPTGTVMVGTGTQTVGVAAGSRFGLTRVEAGNLVIQGGGVADASARLGYDAAGQGAEFSVSGPISVTVRGNLTATGGSADAAFVQIGHGGADASFGGVIGIDAGGDVTFETGSGDDAYAMLGHGSDRRAVPGAQYAGARAGDIMLRVGESAHWRGSQVGHLTASGVLSVTQGNTWLAVSQNAPAYADGTGAFVITGFKASRFSSAPTANGGELRIYLPRADRQQTPTNAAFNGSSFATANTIPPARIQGYFLFGDGPYAPPYSFYLGIPPDVSVGKRATPATGALRPGQTLTYTLSFSNTGAITATGVVLRDTLPGLLNLGSVSRQPDAGVVMTQTSGAPNLAWAVSALAPNKGGKVVIVTNVQNSAAALGKSFTNTATITATGDITLSNNVAALSRNVVAAATLVVTKSVVGATPGAVWQFNASGGISNFTLPAVGGSKVITGLIPATFAVTETTKSGYSSAVSCTNGASGTNSVQVTPTPGTTTGCTFTNTALPGTLIITKTLVGSVPAAAWQFSGSGGIGGFTLPASGGSKSISSLSAATYAVTETVKSGYSSAVSCTNGASGTNHVQVALNPGATIGCTFTNTALPVTLTITKTVVGSALANAWQFAGSGSIGNFTIPASGGSQSFNVAAGSYSVTETVKSGYSATVACTNGASGANKVTVALTPGQTAGCTFTNTQITQTLTVNKVVSGGPLDADDFPLFVDGTPITRGVPKQLSAGQHTVSETGVSTYTAAFGGACNAAGVVNLASGSHMTCVITNTYMPPVVITQTLTVDKVVVGGPLGADDFPLFVDGAPVGRGVASELSAGAHTVSETGVSTYTAVFGGACNAAGEVNLASGSHVSCMITNTYVPPVVITQTLRVNKVVVGGPLTANAFPLFVDGVRVNGGVPKQLAVGQHTVSETGVPTYTAAFGGACNATGIVNLASGAHLTCVITNTYVPPVITQTLTVNKVVAGGPAKADDFALFVDGVRVSRGVPKQLAAGQHTVSETRVPTYTASFGGACNAAGQVNLASGSHAVCTITNTYVPPSVITQTLTVEKVVVGGLLEADAFPLFVDGEVITRGVPTLLATGVHTVSEGPLLSLLYKADFGGACNAAGRVNLAAGARATCTITNTFAPPPIPDLGAVTGRVYEDRNDNDQADEGEGLPGVTVILQSGAGVAAAFTRSDVTSVFGVYEFLPVPVNDYTLYFVPPDGYMPLADESVSVGAGETVEVDDRVAIKAPNKIYLPALRR